MRVGPIQKLALAQIKAEVIAQKANCLEKQRSKLSGVEVAKIVDLEEGGATEGRFADSEATGVPQPKPRALPFPTAPSLGPVLVPSPNPAHLRPLM